MWKQHNITEQMMALSKIEPERCF